MKKILCLSLLATACGNDRPQYVVVKNAKAENAKVESANGEGDMPQKSGETPRQSPGQAPIQAPGQSPIQSPGQSPGQSPNQGSQMPGTELEAGSEESDNYKAADAFRLGQKLKARGDKMIFTVQSASAARSSMKINYTSSQEQTLAVYVNGLKSQDIKLPAAKNASAQNAEIALRAGLNTISFVNEANAGPELSIEDITVKNAAPRAKRGASLPFTTYEAETGKSDAMKVGPSRGLFDFATGASGREAVTLQNVGNYVEWTTKADANALVLRFSIPQGSNGSISLYVNGKKVSSLALASKYAWLYGIYQIPNGFSKDPSQGNPHRAFDETRLLLKETIPAGATLRVQRDQADAPATVDLIELEMAPEPYTQPEGSLSVVDFGAKADDGQDDTEALQKAFTAGKAQGKTVWLPVGTFEMSRRFEVDHLTLRGAGPWYSVLHGANFKGGFHGTGDEVRLFDFAIQGECTSRKDQDSDAAIDGILGRNSMMQNLWIEHTKVGIWSENPTIGLYFVGNRVRNVYADGVNFYSGTVNSAADHNHFRNTGDDAMAMWPDKESVDYNRFRFNSIQLPDLASGVAVYGGKGNEASDNMIADTREAAAGIMVGSHYDRTAAFGDTTLFERNTLIRTGGYERNYRSAFGAIFVWADKTELSAPMVFRDIEVIDANYQGILMSYNKQISNVTFERVNVKNPQTMGIEVIASGSMTVKECSIIGAKMPNALPLNGFTVNGNFN